MNKFVDALQQSRQETRRWFYMCLILAGVAGYAMWGWKTAPRDLTVHIPPDLRNGATLRTGTSPEVPDTTVYTFAFYMWQQINHWQTDGGKDYGEQIYSLQNFLTPMCREQLVADMNQRSNAGELARRTRAVMEIPGMGYLPERVVVLGSNTWKVLLDTQVQETQGNVSVKDAFIRYPLRVVRFDVDREKNPWGLAIDCFGAERPARLDAKVVDVAKTGRTLAEVRTDAFAAAVPVAFTPAGPGTGTGTGTAMAVPGAPASPAPAPLAAASISPTTLPRPTN